MEVAFTNSLSFDSCFIVATQFFIYLLKSNYPPCNHHVTVSTYNTGDAGIEISAATFGIPPPFPIVTNILTTSVAPDKLTHEMSASTK